MPVSLTVLYGKDVCATTLDQTQSLDEVLRVLVFEVLQLQGVDPLDCCLRFNDSDEYVDLEALQRRVKDGDVLKLGLSPYIEAIDYVGKLQCDDVAVHKASIFSLQSRLREDEFVSAFMAADGVQNVMRLVEISTGNTLAYGLLALLTLIEKESALKEFDKAVIDKLVEIVVSENLVNICRPATAIIVKLLDTDVETNGEHDLVRMTMVSITNLGVLPTLMERMCAKDYVLQLNSLMLINALFKNTMSSKDDRESFVQQLNQLSIWQRTMDAVNANSTEEFIKEVVELQRHFIQDMHRRKKTQIDLNIYPQQQILLDSILAITPGDDSINKIKLLGSDNLQIDLERVGQLGLELMASFVTIRKNTFIQWTQELASSSSINSTCSFIGACSEITEVLCDMWEISAGVTTSTTFMPALLMLPLVHALGTDLLKSLCKGAIANDMTKSVGMARSHIRHVLKQDTTKITVEYLEKELLFTKQDVIHQRYMKELEEEDELMNKPAVRELREMVYKESYEFVRQQRILCLYNGAWFNLHSGAIGKDGKNPRNMVRFCKLSASKKTLHYADFSEMTEKKPLLEALNERVELSTIKDILTGTSSPIHTNLFLKRTGSDEIPSVWCFSLMLSLETSAMDLICSTYLQFSEWTDGFNALFDRSIANRDTADYITLLTDFQLRLQLLDLAAEGIDIGALPPPPVPPLPTSDAFWYDDIVGITIST